MKKVLFSFILMMTVGLLCAQEVTLEVNLQEGSYVDISGVASLNVQTPDQWNGTELVSSNLIAGTAFCSSNSELMVECTEMFEDLFLMMGLEFSVEGGLTFPFIEIILGSTGIMTCEQGVSPFNVYFSTNGMSLEGIDPGTHVATFMFSLMEL